MAIYLATCCCSDFSLYSLQTLHLSSSYLQSRIVVDQESYYETINGAKPLAWIDKIAIPGIGAQILWLQSMDHSVC